MLVATAALLCRVAAVTRLSCGVALAVHTGSLPDTTRAGIAARLGALAIAPADTPAFPSSARLPGAPEDRRASADTLPSAIARFRVWTYNQHGFFYTSTQHPAQILYHWARRPAKADVLLYESPDGPGATARVTLSRGGRYAVITTSYGGDRRTRLVFIDLNDADHPTIDAPTVKLFDDLDARYVFAGNIGAAFYIWTNRDAPNGRVVRIDSDEPRPADARTVVNESTHPLIQAQVTGERIAAVYLDGGRASMRLLSPSGGTGVGGRAVRLPADGSIGAIALGGRRRADTVYYVFQSVLIPPTVYAIDLETAASTPTSMTAPPFDPSAYTVRRIIDSTGAAPLYVVTSRAAATDSTRRPAWVDTAATVSHDDTLASPLEYAPAPIVWLELGGVYVVPAQPGAAAARAAADAVVRLRLARPDRVVIGAPRDADGLAALARVAWN